MGDIYYRWSADNRTEIERGWVMKADSIEGLAKKILAEPDNGGLMSPAGLRASITRYNEQCRNGQDIDFQKPREWLTPIQDPPYYAVKLWPGGPNTQGGPKQPNGGRYCRRITLRFPGFTRLERWVRSGGCLSGRRKSCGVYLIWTDSRNEIDAEETSK